MSYRTVRAGVLDIAYREIGESAGWPVVLLHGFPYDALCYDEAAALLARQGARVILPWLRGYGPTRFAFADTMRSGQQGAIGTDLKLLLDALGLERAILGGFDWGGRAACIVSALWPERVDGLVSAMGYNIIDRRHKNRPASPETEHRLWYVWYFHSLRGEQGLRENRHAFCRQLWQMWSPCWEIDDATYAASAASFDNPDFVDVVIHSYRHRYGLVEGDPAYDAIEARLDAQPPITVPTIALDGDRDGVVPQEGPRDLSRLTGRREHRLLRGIGHNPPQEDPAAFADAVLTLRGWACETHQRLEA